MNIACFFVGAPLSGKGTIGRKTMKMLQDRGAQCAYIDTGHRCRLMAETEEFKHLKPILEAREFVPDRIIMEAVRRELPSKGVVFGDGFPRTDFQAKKLVEMFRNKAGWTMVLVILNADPDLLLNERLSSRRLTDPHRTDSKLTTTLDGIQTYEQVTLPAAKWMAFQPDVHALHLTVDTHDASERLTQSVFDHLNRIMHLGAERLTLHGHHSGAAVLA